MDTRRAHIESTSSAIESITLEIDAVDAEVLQEMKWDAIDELLRLPNIPRFTIACTDYARASRAAYEWLFGAVLRGQVLVEAVRMRKLQFSFKWTTKEHGVDCTVSSDDISELARNMLPVCAVEGAA